MSENKSTTSPMESANQRGTYPALEWMEKNKRPLNRQEYLSVIGLTEPEMTGELEETLPPEFRWKGPMNQPQPTVSGEDEEDRLSEKRFKDRRQKMMEDLNR